MYPHIDLALGYLISHQFAEKRRNDELEKKLLEANKQVEALQAQLNEATQKIATLEGKMIALENKVAVESATIIKRSLSQHSATY